MKPLELDQLSPGQAIEVILRHFPWTRKHRAILEDCVNWHAAADPRPNFYYRWHLPRLMATFEILNAASGQSVVDLSCYAPYSIFLEKHALSGAAWTRTGFSQSVETFQVRGERQSVSVLAADLHAPRLPFEAGQFDMAILTETIEHVHIHPQFVFWEINRILRKGGYVLVSTPNVAAWKKIKGLTDGNWNYDSPTFSTTRDGSGSWGHRFEFSPYQMRTVLRAAGFSPVKELFRDIYFDDPRGLAQAAQFWWTLAGKTLTGEARRAAKMWMQSGSGMFLLWRKDRDTETDEPTEFPVI